VVVVERAAAAGAGLDEHFVAALDELTRTRRGERDAVLVRLDLLDDANLHRARNPSLSCYSEVLRPPRRLTSDFARTPAAAAAATSTSPRSFTPRTASDSETGSAPPGT